MEGIRSCDGGFSLLEILVAVAIMAIAFTGILKLYSLSLSMNAASNFYAKAPLMAQRVLSEWNAGMVSQGHPFSVESPLEGFEGYEFEIRQREEMADALTVVVKEGEGPRLVFLECIVVYNQGEFEYRSQGLRLVYPWAE